MSLGNTLEFEAMQLRETDRNKVQEFLQIHHAETFGMFWLSSHLNIPLPQVEQHCNALIAEGHVSRPEHTEYVRGVAVDWAAVHAGFTKRPEWSNQLPW